MSARFDPKAAARWLLNARASGPLCAGLPVGPAGVDDAYAVQAEVMRQLGGRVSWKMALLGGKDRQTAAMPASEVFYSGATLTGLPPDAAIEVETALMLGADLQPGCTIDAALDAVGQVRLAFEIIGSRFADRATVSPLEAMADSFSSAGIVLGDAIPDWRKALEHPLNLALVLDDRPVTATEQWLSLNETANFLRWLATHAAQQGMPLCAGTVIITGARIGPIPLSGVRAAVARSEAAQVRVALSDHVLV